MTPEDRTGRGPVGHQTMSPAMRDMGAYRRYLFRLVEPALGDRVWEIGVGHGGYTALLRESGRSVLATDIDDECLQEAGARFSNDAAVDTAHIDLTDHESIARQAGWRADSIICLNVLEHIEYDVAALDWLREAAAPRATLGIVVPAHPRLYGRMDREAGHFRRYTRRTLRTALTQAGWRVERLRYVNLVGAMGWWYHNRVRKDAGLQDVRVNRQMLRADAWLPRLARFTDPLFGRCGGLSVLAIARAESPAAEIPTL